MNRNQYLFFALGESHGVAKTRGALRLCPPIAVRSREGKRKKGKTAGVTNSMALLFTCDEHKPKRLALSISPLAPFRLVGVLTSLTHVTCLTLLFVVSSSYLNPPTPHSPLYWGRRLPCLIRIPISPYRHCGIEFSST